MSARSRQVLPVALIALVVMLLLRLGYDLSWNRADEVETAVGTIPPGDTTSPAPSPTQPAEEAHWTLASGPPVGSTRWSLAVTRSGGGFCVELSTSLGSTTSSCGHDGRTLQILRSSAGAGRTFLFGPVSREADRVWITSHDGRTVEGSVYDVPMDPGVRFSLYLLVVKTARPGVVVAVDRQGLLVGHAHYSTSGDPERTYGWPDAYGDIIGYVPGPGDWGFVPPGRPAAMADIRTFLMAPLTRVDPRIREWWADRPTPGSDATTIAQWWADYPADVLRLRPS